MTRPFDKHLDSDEFDGLISSPSADAADSILLSQEAMGEVRSHIANCQDCAKKVQMHDRVQNELRALAAHSQLPPGSDCLPDGEWIKVAAGLKPEMETKTHLRHAAQCEHCGSLLRDAVAALSSEVSANEEEILEGLDSARPGWQMMMAERLQSTTSGKSVIAEKNSLRKGFTFLPRLGWALAGLVAVVAAGWIGMRILGPPTAQILLAKAYTDNRTIEVRIPGAKFAPMRPELRGSSDTSNADRPLSLSFAQIEIKLNLANNPNAPAWLDAKARGDLLDGKYDLAVEELRRASEISPDSEEIWRDLGSAYFARAAHTSPTVSKESADDSAMAVNELSKALQKSPEDPVALYNLAIAEERLSLFEPAIHDWEHYLLVDPNGDWADDARQKLAALREKVKRLEKSLSAPLLSPQDIFREGADKEALRIQVDARIEEYLKLAITDWLPRAFPVKGDASSFNAENALIFLASIAREYHQDTWLTDLLGSTSGAGFQNAVAALALSVQANQHGDYSAGRSSAHKSAELFRLAGNSAGELRANVEEIYSDHLLWEGDRCEVLLRSVKAPLNGRSYTWLQAQADLEESNCGDLVGDLGIYLTALDQGTRKAEESGYTALYLRGLGFRAQAAASFGDASTGIELSSKGLALFWSGEGDLMKGYNLYTDLDAASDDLRLANLQVIISRQATSLIDHHPDLLLRAMAHRWYGNAAYLADMPELAESEYSKAATLFAASPRTVATTRDRMDAEVWLAQIQIRQGDVEQAAARLQGVKLDLENTPSFNPEIGFYTAQADLGMKRLDSAATESALRSAIFLSEWALDSFPSEGGRRSWAEQTRSAYRNAVEWKLRSGDPTAALELWEWYRGAELRATQHEQRHDVGDMDSANPPDPRDAPPLPEPTVVSSQRSRLRDETGITYGIFPDGIAIWVFDDRGVYAQWISTPLPAVQELTSQFQRLCSDPASDPTALRKTGRLIYDLLIAPVEGRLNQGRTLLIEPDGFFEEIPWEALVDRGGHYLIERAAIVVSPGLYRAMNLRPAIAITTQSPALVVSVPTAPAEGLSPLTDAEIEAESVAGRFGSARLLSGNEATLSTVRHEIRNAIVMHFAGHAVSSALRTGLVLSEIDPTTRRSRLISAGTFTLSETSHLQLVVLSACHTSAGAPPETSATEGLVQSLLHANVPHVIASRWDVDSTQAAKLMKRFYEHLLSGSDTASSLRDAELALASQAASAHPYYWSAFELQGLK